MSPAKKGTVLKKMCKSGEALFNKSYDKMPAMPLSDENNTNNVLDGHLKMGMGAEQLDAEFGGLEAFFDSNELVLTCDGMAATKLAVFADSEEDYGYPIYFGIIEGSVVTAGTINDVSWIGFLAPVGETSYVRAAICASVDKSTAYYGCEGFAVERLY